MAYALLSVFDKTNLLPLAVSLQTKGYTLLASGNTAAYITSHGLQVTQVSDYTHMPEMLGGRVKTLHPAIHAGLLARETEADQNELARFGFSNIDVVVVNLYPFEKTVQSTHATRSDIIEQIDIGGVCLLRAAAKNHERVTVLCDPEDYTTIIQTLTADEPVSEQARQKLAAKAFALTARYDTAISQYLANEPVQTLTLYPRSNLRYGENPHQQAKLYTFSEHQGPLGGKLLSDKQLSYNNLLDLDAAFKTVSGFKDPTVCIVKHVSACGIASASYLHEAFPLALACDPVSAFGGIIGCNRIVDQQTVEAFGKLFIECIVAPGFTVEALHLLHKRPNCRLLQIDDFKPSSAVEYRSIHLGILEQTQDTSEADPESWQIVSHKKPTSEHMASLVFAWRACQPVKSNTIVLVQQTATVGIGSGQPNRVDCLHIAAKRAGNKAKGAILASDAFFPFADTVHAAADYGISAIVQPGGSIRDHEVIEAANERGMTLILTGKRHFRH